VPPAAFSRRLSGRGDAAAEAPAVTRSSEAMDIHNSFFIFASFKIME
jgi:hypothetical protein